MMKNWSDYTDEDSKGFYEEDFDLETELASAAPAEVVQNPTPPSHQWALVCKLRGTLDETKSALQRTQAELQEQKNTIQELQSAVNQDQELKIQLEETREALHKREEELTETKDVVHATYVDLMAQIECTKQIKVARDEVTAELQETKENLQKTEMALQEQKKNNLKFQSSVKAKWMERLAREQELNIQLQEKKEELTKTRAEVTELQQNVREEVSIELELTKEELKRQVQEKTKLQQQLKSELMKNALLNREIETMEGIKAVRRELEHQHKQQLEELQKINAEKNEAITDREKMMDCNKEQWRTIHKLQDQIKELQSTKEQNEDWIKVLRYKNNKLTEAHQNTSEFYNKEKLEKQNIEELSVKIRGRLTELIKDNIQLKTQVEDMEEEKQDFQAACEESRQEANMIKESLQNQEQVLREELKREKEQNTELWVKYSEVKKISVDGKTRVKELEEKLEEKCIQVKTITSQLNADRDNFKTSISKSKTEFDTVVKEKDVLLKTIQTHQRDLEIQQQKMEELSMELVKLKKEVLEKNTGDSLKTTNQKMKVTAGSVIQQDSNVLQTTGSVIQQDSNVLQTTGSVIQQDSIALVLKTAESPMSQLTKQKKKKWWRFWRN